MRSLVRGWGRVALGAALLAAVSCAAVRPSAAAPAVGACDGDSGVTVVVDFGTLGGGVQTRCAPEPVSSGFDALTRAGFTYEGTARFQGLLCRIDGKPSTQQDPCQNAPSPTYYWAYWTAPAPGGAWTYSDAGAGNRDPAPGTVEGWAFSDGCTRKPGAATACPGSTTTTTTTSSPSPTTTQARAASGPVPPRGGSVTTTAASASTTTASGSADPGAGTATLGALPTSGDDARATGGDSPAPSTGETALARGVAAPSAGSPVGLLAGAGVALLLGLGAAARLRLRRRSSPSAAGPE
jgi:hypothetical protein